MPLLLVAPSAIAPLAAEPGETRSVSGEMRYAGGVLRVTFKPAQFRFTTADMIDWVGNSARAVSVYFGRFPVPLASLDIEPASSGIISKGSANSAAIPHIRLDLGRSTSGEYLATESVLVHEMTHLALPALPPKFSWLQEGVATYVEHVARAQAGLITPQELWSTFAAEMPNGLPDARETGGLDRANSVGRRYWGGAIFCLLADVEIRRATGNKLGLQDALRAIQREGGNLSQEWSMEHTIEVADQSTGTKVLAGFYQSLGTRSASPDLGLLWRELGVRASRGNVTLVDTAPLAQIRMSISNAPSVPLLIAQPTLVREAAIRQADAR